MTPSLPAGSLALAPTPVVSGGAALLWQNALDEGESPTAAWIRQELADSALKIDDRGA